MITEQHRALVARAAEIHRAQGCWACATIRAAAGDEAALAEVIEDARRVAMARWA